MCSSFKENDVSGLWRRTKHAEGTVMLGCVLSRSSGVICPRSGCVGEAFTRGFKHTSLFTSNTPCGRSYCTRTCNNPNNNAAWKLCATGASSRARRGAVNCATYLFVQHSLFFLQLAPDARQRPCSWGASSSAAWSTARDKVIATATSRASRKVRGDIVHCCLEGMVRRERSRNSANTWMHPVHMYR